jgi:hypothetical protein
VYWKTYIETGGYLVKRGLTNDVNFYVTDNLGNKYNAISWGGNVAQEASISETPTAGWFLFSQPKPGATSFTFWDMYEVVSIGDIVLSPDKNVNPPAKTPTLDPNTKFNEPGTYIIYKCVSYPSYLVFAGATTVNLCLTTVVINEVYEMRFNLKWTAHFDQVMKTIKPSDAGNQNIILIDNLNNVYHHTQTGGCAAQETELFTG